MDKKACDYTPKQAHHIELRCFRILGSAHARGQYNSSLFTMTLLFESDPMVGFCHQRLPEVVPGRALYQPVADIFHLLTLAFLAYSLLPVHSLPPPLSEKVLFPLSTSSTLSSLSSSSHHCAARLTFKVYNLHTCTVSYQQVPHKHRVIRNPQPLFTSTEMCLTYIGFQGVLNPIDTEEAWYIVLRL